MDQVKTLADYPTLVKQAMQEYRQAAVEGALAPLPYELALVFDDEHQQYILRSVGWQKNKRILTTILHVAIRNGKLWIEEDWAEEGIATYFLEHGVPNDQIVLGFHAPTMRPLHRICRGVRVDGGTVESIVCTDHRSTDLLSY